MTFDDGIVEFYDKVNANPNGDFPKEELVLNSRYYYSAQQLGITRYYEALRSAQELSKVIEIWRADVNVNQIAIIDGKQYQIRQVQDDDDEFQLPITRLSLERVAQNFTIRGENS